MKQEQGLGWGMGLIVSQTHSHSLSDVDPGAHNVIGCHGLEGGKKSSLAWEVPGPCGSGGGGGLNEGTLILGPDLLLGSGPTVRMPQMPGHPGREEDNRAQGVHPMFSSPGQGDPWRTMGPLGACLLLHT